MKAAKALQKLDHMRRILDIFILLSFVAGCAKIPVQSVALADALQVEGERMHRLNTIFLNRIFLSKRDEIEKFIKEQYAPMVVQNMMKGVNEADFKANLKTDLPEFTSAVTGVVNTRRDSLVTALELQKEKIVEKLNADYAVYNTGALELKRLLESAVKVDKEKQALFTQAKTLSNNRIDFTSLEAAIDKFIHASGNVGNNAQDLNNIINRLLTNK
jgi:hypothetical protein